MSQILITGSNPYNDNKGVSALCYSLVAILDDIIKDKSSNITIAVYNHEFANLEDELKMGSYGVKIRSVFPSSMNNISNVLKTLTTRWRLFNLKEFYKSDIVLSVNAGDSFADIYGDKIFNNVNHANQLALLFNKPLILLPQTYGPFVSGGKSEQKAKHIIKKSKVVISRDRESAEYVKSILPTVDVEELIDLAFFLPYKKVELDNSYINVGINISALLWNGGYTQNNQFGLSHNYADTVEVVLNNFLKKENVKVHLVPHVVGDRYFIENDYVVAYELWKKYKSPNLVLSPFFISPVEAKSYISALDMFLGSRMHACIAAYSSGVPVVPMAYSRKFSGLFTETLKYDYNVNLKELSINQIIERIETAFENREAIKQQISEINDTLVKERKDKLYSLIKEQIDKYIQ